VSRSHVLAAMQAEPHISKGVLRVSLGWQSRAEDTQKLVNEWSKLAGQTLAAE
jgi:cysteine desulfurase